MTAPLGSKTVPVIFVRCPRPYEVSSKIKNSPRNDFFTPLCLQDETRINSFDNSLEEYPSTPVCANQRIILGIDNVREPHECPYFVLASAPRSRTDHGRRFTYQLPEAPPPVFIGRGMSGIIFPTM